MKNRFSAAIALSMFAILIAPSTAAAQQAQAAAARPVTLEQAVNRAISYFEQAQADDGSFSASSGPGITAIVASAMLRNGRTVNDPVVARALKYLEGHQHDDGGIYQNGSRYKNYETSLSIVCFNEANKDGRYNELLANAEKFVKAQ